MKKITKDDVKIPYKTGRKETGLYADFAADNTLEQLGYYEDGRLIEELSFGNDAPDGRLAKYDYFTLSGDYQGNFEGLDAMGISAGQFDAMSAEEQNPVVDQLEHMEWVADQIAYISRDRTPDYTVYCSFCGKASTEVKKIIAGPSTYICNECIAMCNDIMTADNTA